MAERVAKLRKRPLNRYVTVYQQSAATSANTDGGFEEVQSEYCKRWCRAWVLRGTEEEQLIAVLRWIAEMRYDDVTAAITPKMWIVLPGGERLNITAAYDPDGRKRKIEIRAKQNV